MNKIILAIATLVISQSVYADQQTDMLKYIDFITKWTSYKYNGEALPKIKVEKDALVQVFAYGDYEYAQAEAKGVALPTVVSVYDAGRKTIYVSDKMDATAPMYTVTMIHELVHYLQDISGFTASLDGHLSCTESEAYDVQMLWQIENKINVAEVPFVEQRSLVAAMKCMGNQSAAFPKLDLNSIPEIRDYKKKHGIED